MPTALSSDASPQGCADGNSNPVAVRAARRTAKAKQSKGVGQDGQSKEGGGSFSSASETGRKRIKKIATRMDSFFDRDHDRIKRNQREKRLKVRAARAALQATNKHPPPGEKKDKRLRSKAARAAAKLWSRPEELAREAEAASIAKAGKRNISKGQDQSRPAGKRTNYSTDNKMSEAVEEWFSLPPEQRKSKAKFARDRGLGTQSFTRRVRDDPKKRLAVDAKAGRKSLLSSNAAEFLVQHTILADRANNGFAPADVVENLLEMQPQIAPEQARNYVKRTFKKMAKGRLKPRPVKAQKTTSKRSQITAAQQYRWLTNYQKALTFLREKNTGLCNETGKTFGEVIDHFIVGGDETNLQADDAGNLYIFGETGRKKHEKRAGEFRTSITMYRTGTPAGHNGPTAFVLKGKNKLKGVTDSFLRAEGCAPGSTTVMTENAFVTTEAWVTIAPSVSRIVIKHFSFVPCINISPALFYTAS